MSGLVTTVNAFSFVCPLISHNSWVDVLKNLYLIYHNIFAYNGRRSRKCGNIGTLICINFIFRKIFLHTAV